MSVRCCRTTRFFPLAKTILELGTGAKAIPNFKVVDTRDTIEPAKPGATKKSGDWRNEIPPAKSGYAKLAKQEAGAIPGVG
jgi:hypothetical protein